MFSLPDMLGWTVLNHLKQDPGTRHIPVQMLTLDEDRHHGLSRGAFAFETKPTTSEELVTVLTRIKAYAMPRRKRLLIVEDNPGEQLSIQELLGYEDIDVTAARRARKRSPQSWQPALRLRGARSSAAGETGFDVLERACATHRVWWTCLLSWPTGKEFASPTVMPGCTCSRAASS